MRGSAHVAPSVLPVLARVRAAAGIGIGDGAHLARFGALWRHLDSELAEFAVPAGGDVDTGGGG